MLNRRNLKVTTVGFFTLALAIWFLGRVLYHLPGQEEIDCFDKYDQAEAYNQTNAITKERRVMDRSAQSIIDDDVNGPDVKIEAMKLESSISHADMDDEEEAHHWLEKAEELDSMRRDHRHEFNLVALGPLCLSALFGLLFYLTAPSRPSP